MIDDTNVNCDHEWHDYVQAINRPDGGIYVPAGKTAKDIAGFEYLGQMCAKCGKVEPPESVVNPKLPATGPYVDRIIRIFRDRCYDDGSAIVLHDYAVEALRLNTAIAQQPSNAVPDDECLPYPAPPGRIVSHGLEWFHGDACLMIKDALSDAYRSGSNHYFYYVGRAADRLLAAIKAQQP